MGRALEGRGGGCGPLGADVTNLGIRVCVCVFHVQVWGYLVGKVALGGALGFDKVTKV